MSSAETISATPAREDVTSVELLERIVLPDSVGSYFYVKRSFDVITAAVLLILLLPLFAAVALAIKLDTRGPVIFVQQRVGARRRRSGSDSDAGCVWEGRLFRFYKFRSMVSDADPHAHEEAVRAYVAGRASRQGPKQIFKLHDDPRVTRVGRHLRRWSIDELPQLLNVITGDMSLVGPRPLPVYEAVLYRDEHLARFGTLPGLTGPWQVAGRCDLPFEEMIRLDLSYALNQSFAADLGLLLRTIPAVVSGRGAE